jgi:glycosyltransferase involved in cell wall biosynthesis
LKINETNIDSSAFFNRSAINDSHPSKRLISVIIPSFQEEKIITSLESVYTSELKSKYNFEVILSDGGSTDKTVALARNFADKITVHTSVNRQTISEGRNKGAEIAEGEVLVFINADTYPKDIDKFFTYITNWAKNPKTTFHAIACEVHGFPEEITKSDELFYSLHNKYVNFLNKINLGMGRGECQIVHRDYFKKVNGYNPLIVAGEDFDLFRRLSKITKIKFEPELVVLESPRRFRKYGYLKTIWFWTLNSIAIIFLGKSYSKEWEAIR